jgi:hypothetical protein
MAFPPTFYPVTNKTMFRHVNWTWAPPGAQGNVCVRCGSNCFCAAEAGLLPRTRSAHADPNSVMFQAVDAADTAEANQDTEVAHASSAAAQVEMQDGIMAIMQYDSDE